MEATELESEIMEIELKSGEEASKDQSFMVAKIRALILFFSTAVNFIFSN